MEYKGTITGAVIGIVTATVTLLIAFGVHISSKERDAIIAEATAITAIAPAIGAVLDHGKAQAESRTSAAIITSQKP